MKCTTTAPWFLAAGFLMALPILGFSEAGTASDSPRVLDVTAEEIPATTPSGKMLVLEVKANVCHRAYLEAPIPHVSKLSPDTALLEFSMNANCPNAQLASFMVPIEADLVGEGFDPASVKISWSGRTIWPNKN